MPKRYAHNTPWSAEEIEKLKYLWEETKIRPDEVGKTLGRSKHSVRTKATQLRLTRKAPYSSHGREWSLQEDEELKREWVKPYIPSEEIAGRLGRTVGALYTRAKQLGIKREPIGADIRESIGVCDYKLTDREAINTDEIARLRSLGLTTRQIASILGIGLGTVSRHLNKDNNSKSKECDQIRPIDYFAAAALQGLLANSHPEVVAAFSFGDSERAKEDFAKSAYSFAREMLCERREIENA